MGSQKPYQPPLQPDLLRERLLQTLREHALAQQPGPQLPESSWQQPLQQPDSRQLLHQQQLLPQEGPMSSQEPQQTPLLPRSLQQQLLQTLQEHDLRLHPSLQHLAHPQELSELARPPEQAQPVQLQPLDKQCCIPRQNPNVLPYKRFVSASDWDPIARQTRDERNRKEAYRKWKRANGW